MTWISQLFGFFKEFALWFVIAPWEAGIRVRRGKNAAKMGPGIHWRIPFLDRIFVQSVRLRTIFGNDQTMSTRDGKVLTVRFSVIYQIDDILKMYSVVSNPESTLLATVQGLLARHISKSNYCEISASKLESLATDEIPSSDWGLGSVKLVITTFAFVKTYRLLGNYDYQSTSRANELEPVKA